MSWPGKGNKDLIFPSLPLSLQPGTTPFFTSSFSSISHLLRKTSPFPFPLSPTPLTLFSSLFWTALLSHIFLPVNARVIFSLLCRDFKQTGRGIRGLDEVPSISIAFRLLLHPLCDGGKQGSCATPQPNRNWEECKSPGLQISEAAQLSGAGRR